MSAPRTRTSRSSRLRRGLRLPRSERCRQDDDGAHTRHAAGSDLGLGENRRNPAQSRGGFRYPSAHLDHARVPGPHLRLTVAENLECFAGLYELTDIGGRIAKALESVNLTDRANDLCGSLSKGLRQRVALARSLLNDPAVLFLDEPTSGLDPVATRDVHELISALRDQGVTIFLTTHRLEEAERLCHRVAILNTTLLLIGRPDELRARLFTRTLEVRTRVPLPDPGGVFKGVADVEEWEQSASGSYVLHVADPDAAAPGVARALVAADADILSIVESLHSLEDVYLELVDEDVEAKQ